MHKPRIAKDSEVVVGHNGLVHAALRARKLSKAARRRWSARQTRKQKRIEPQRAQPRDLHTMSVHSVRDREGGSNSRLLSPQRKA